MEHDFTKVNPSLDNVTKALRLLNNPQDSFQSIQVAGTNGKGSVCNFLELYALNHLDSRPKVAKYTSPHYLSVCERIVVDGKEISQCDFDQLWQEFFGNDALLSPEQLAFDLSYFEKLTVLAFEYFRRQKVDLAILEVGLGGRWDATNVISPEKTLATAITSIGLDHQEYLGNTIEEIRAEKEAIKKTGVKHFDYLDLPDCSGAQAGSLSPNDINGSNFILASQIFEYISQEKLNDMQKQKIHQEFESKQKGRFEYLLEENIILDSAHNPDAAKSLASFVNAKAKPGGKRYWLIGLLDKDYKGFLQELDFREGDCICFSNIQSERSQDAQKLKQYLEAKQPNVFAFKDISEASEFIDKERQVNETLIVTGSIYLLGEFYQLGSDQIKKKIY